jgi:hypothetical protein
MTTTQLPAEHIAILRLMAHGDGTLPVDVMRGMNWNIIPDLLCAGVIVQRKPKYPGGSWFVLTELGRKEAQNAKPQA